MMDAENPFELLDRAEHRSGPGAARRADASIYHAPVVVGDTLTFQSRVTDVVDKKGGAMT